MYNRSDPRFRRRIAQLTSNLESATESTQVGLFSFSEHYLKPCFSTLSTPFEPCLARCFPSSEERKRRRRARGRGRPEYSFDFYDDWAEDESDALLSLEGEEFERVMGGSGSGAESGGGAGVGETPTTRQPDRQRNMTYGSRDDRFQRPRKRSLGRVYDSKDDPTVIPSQSRFGFFSRLPFRLGSKGKALRYEPSSADLQERTHVKNDLSGGGAATRNGTYHDDDSLIDDRRHGPGDSRIRSTTAGSGHTTDSYSSRGDIFPSEDEADADAVPLGDEFAVAMLDRRNTNTYDESSSGNTGRGSAGRKYRPGGGTSSSTRTMSSKSEVGRRRRSRSSEIETQERGASDGQRTILLAPESEEDKIDSVNRGKEAKQDNGRKGSGSVSMVDLKAEEAKLQADEEAEIARRRESAMQLAKEKGLSTIVVQGEQQMQMRSLSTPSPNLSAAISPATIPGTAFPFPNMPPQELRTPLRSKDTSARSSMDVARPSSATHDSSQKRDDT